MGSWPIPIIGRRHLIVGMSLALGVAVAFGLRAAGARAVAPSCPNDDGGLGVILCEDFENGAFERNWIIGSRGGTWPMSDFVRCDDEGFGFQDRCAAWSNRLLFDDEWGFWGYDARRRFPPQEEFYLRWYQYISTPYIWGTLEDKSVPSMDPDERLITYVGTNRNHLPTERNSGPGMPFIANYQDVDWRETGNWYTRVNRFQNQGANLTLQPGNMVPLRVARQAEHAGHLRRDHEALDRRGRRARA